MRGSGIAHKPARTTQDHPISTPGHDHLSKNPDSVRRRGVTGCARNSGRPRRAGWIERCEVRFLLLICTEKTSSTGVCTSASELDPTGWVKEMSARGVRLFGEQLAPAEGATTVRLREAQVLLSDGPFAENNEQICGFDLIECADLDEAIEVASKHPMARFGLIEVRPLWTPLTHSQTRFEVRGTQSWSGDPSHE